MSDNVIVLRRTYHSPAGRSTYEVVTNSNILVTWLQKTYRCHESGVISEYRINSKRRITFKCGSGYDTIDMDLLGGDGSGRTKRAFENETGYFFQMR